ncbi:MAG TPA: hypothetical protein VNT26_19330, partial [Candidatus Sulfotelmatobacter sp.]|nr:hypothetical protein [Candidatus Sulfotelmatobacter sp.]
AKAKKVHPDRLKGLSLLVSPRTLLEWHQRLVVRKYDGSVKRAPGRPSAPAKVRELVLQMARQNGAWGYTRLQGALRNLGHEIGRGTIAKVLKEAGLEPAPERQKKTTWKEFLRTHWDVLAAADFFSVEVWTTLGLVRYHVFFVMRLATREVHIAGITLEPNGAWMKQMARNLTDGLDGFLKDCRYLLHDRGSVFTEEFGMILQGTGIEAVRLPASSRFVLHYHQERNHQGLENKLIRPAFKPLPSAGAIRCRQCLGDSLENGATTHWTFQGSGRMLLAYFESADLPWPDRRSVFVSDRTSPTGWLPWCRWLGSEHADPPWHAAQAQPQQVRKHLGRPVPHRLAGFRSGASS